MKTNRRSLRIVLALLCATLAAASAAWPAQTSPGDGWQIPEDAAGERNLAPIDAAVLAKGQRLYKSKCLRCHGTAGKGDGPDRDPSHAPGDLTDGGRASRNPDGVLFYKIWNGRRQPKMPAMKTDIAREDVWAIVQYVKTLRR
jgi:mono/diheme cytochrome c family protein